VLNIHKVHMSSEFLYVWGTIIYRPLSSPIFQHDAALSVR
jgi:hypothetical protein